MTDSTLARGRTLRRSPLLKILLAWVAAFALAAGHHAFYQSLDGRPSSGSTSSFAVHSQAGASAIGTAFAVVVSSALTLSAVVFFISAVIQRYLQLVWKMVQQRSFSVAALNALWSIPKSPSGWFASPSFWRSGPGATVVFFAVLARAFKLITTFAPGTLTIDTSVTITNASCSVPSFDFTNHVFYQESYFTEDDHTVVLGIQASTIATRTIGATVLAGTALPPKSICTANCSYTLTLVAPSFSCTPNTQLAPALSSGTAFASRTFDSSAPLAGFAIWDFQMSFVDLAGITCIAYNSTYELQYDFIGSVSSVKISNLVAANTTVTTNYHLIAHGIYSFILGNITVLNAQPAGVGLDFQPPKLATPQLLIDTDASNLTAGNVVWSISMAANVEKFLSDTVLSIITLNLQTASATDCTFSDISPHFVYNKGRLWLIYGLGIGLALLADLVGTAALRSNGFGAGGKFGDFLVATRNPELDALADRVELRRWIKMKQGGLQLRFGPLRSAGGRYAFAEPESLVGDRELMTPGSVKEFLPASP
ncbi:hypothetical protein R3P38DRAFT_3329784 [Favolaschia claudopus]|uniref:Uncharacterized protein n=1 Tax=Favolaschia claudopus TaxID=2862362 RepID=A0AAV9ZXQ0_9AGAR